MSPTLKETKLVFSLAVPKILRPSILRSSCSVNFKRFFSYSKALCLSIDSIYSMAEPKAMPPTILGVPASNLKGSSLKVAFEYEKNLLKFTEKELLKIDGLRIFGTAKEKTSLVSFNVGDIHPFDIGTLLDKQGIAVRTGHHCTQPLMDFYEIPGTLRASFSIYNTVEEVSQFLTALKRAISVLS